MIEQKELEFYTGFTYETRKRETMICLVHDGPCKDYPIVMMNIDTGFPRLYKPNGRVYYYSEDENDIVRMVPLEPNYDVIAAGKLIQQNLAIIKEFRRIEEEVINPPKEEGKEEKKEEPKLPWTFWEKLVFLFSRS